MDRTPTLHIERAMSSAHRPALSPAQAAEYANVSRRSIVRAINVQEIKAERDNKNNWRIDPDSLEAWAAKSLHIAHPDSAHPDSAHPEVGESDQLRRQIEALRDRAIAAEQSAAVAQALLDAERRRAATAEADRDQWRHQAQRSIWSRMFGR